MKKKNLHFFNPRIKQVLGKFKGKLQIEIQEKAFPIFLNSKSVLLWSEGAFLYARPPPFWSKDNKLYIN